LASSTPAAAPPAPARLAALGVPARQAASDGRLVIGRGSPGYDPVHGFDPAARTDYWVAAAEDARTDGLTGLRVAGDMAWAAGSPAGAGTYATVDAAALTAYELGLTPLLAELGLTGLCEYDRRVFPAGMPDVVLDTHPLSVVPDPGTLHAVREGGVLRLAGDADLATRTAFELAVREPGLTLIDLTGLAFVDAHCARELVRLGGSFGPSGTGVTLECTQAQARLLRLCGIRQPASLVVRGAG
jgi:anti-anti-sigma regulatory factor